MANGNNTDRSYELAREIFLSGLAADPTNADFVARHNRSIQFAVQGEDPFVVDVRNGKIEVYKGTLDDPDLLVKCDQEVLRQVFRGLLSPGEAWMSDRWWIGGAFSDYVGTSWMMRLIKFGVRSRLNQVWD